jgi:hypothetical protein
LVKREILAFTAAKSKSLSQREGDSLRACDDTGEMFAVWQSMLMI